MGVKSITLLLVSSLALAGCQTTKPTIAVTTVEKPELILPPVDNVRLNNIQWFVVSKNTKPGEEGSVDKAFGKANSESLFAITPKSYEHLAINNAQLVRTIKQLQAQVSAYREYYSNQSKQEEQGKK